MAFLSHTDSSMVQKAGRGWEAGLPQGLEDFVVVVAIVAICIIPLPLLTFESYLVFH